LDCFWYLDCHTSNASWWCKEETILAIDLSRSTYHIWLCTGVFNANFSFIVSRERPILQTCSINDECERIGQFKNVRQNFDWITFRNSRSKLRGAHIWNFPPEIRSSPCGFPSKQVESVARCHANYLIRTGMED
jgi:hypothetical protein